MRTYTLSDIEALPINTYGVIGCPVEHSVSPIIHNALSGSLNYNRIMIRPEELAIAFPILKAKLKGFNCTIPHKLAIMEYVDYLDESARQYGAINTIKIEKGKIYGYNTDGIGFLAALKSVNMTIYNKNVLLCGNGGVARVMAFETIKGNSSLTIFCRNTLKGEQLREDIISLFPKADIKVTNKLDCQKFDILLNGTPQGMYPNIDDIPVNESVLDNVNEVYDTIYNPLSAKLLIEARARGKKTQNGLYMLVAQAVAARHIWDNSNYNDEQIKDIIKILEKDLR